jgi:hypothetical protein
MGWSADSSVDPRPGPNAGLLGVQSRMRPRTGYVDRDDDRYRQSVMAGLAAAGVCVGSGPWPTVVLLSLPPWMRLPGRRVPLLPLTTRSTTSHRPNTPPGRRPRSPPLPCASGERGRRSLSAGFRRQLTVYRKHGRLLVLGRPPGPASDPSTSGMQGSRHLGAGVIVTSARGNQDRREVT